MPKRSIRYNQRTDFVRAILISFIALAAYGLPLPYDEFITIPFNFARGAIFALYGYYVLKPHQRFIPHIANTFKALFIALLVYVPICCAYQKLVYGSATSWITPPSVLNFLVLNRWPLSFCGSIWFLASTLYALLIFAAFKKLSRFKVLDYIVCGVLFIGLMAVGEFAKLVGLSFYLDASFITLTVPYMLFGKIIRNMPERIKKMPFKSLLIIFICGVLLCALEVYLLLVTNNLLYFGHLFGFIPMTFVTVILATRGPVKTKIDRNVIFTSNLYRAMYYVYNPIADIYCLFVIVLFGTSAYYDTLRGLAGIFTIVVSFIIARLVSNPYRPKYGKRFGKKKKSKGKSSHDNGGHSHGGQHSEGERHRPDFIDSEIESEGIDLDALDEGFDEEDFDDDDEFDFVLDDEQEDDDKKN